MFYILFLPESPEVQYHFRPRSHDKLLIPKTADLSERDFIIRLLYKDCYWHFYILSFYLFTLFKLRVSTFFIKDHDDDDASLYLLLKPKFETLVWDQKPGLRPNQCKK